jgi:hypothetical protein
MAMENDAFQEHEHDALAHTHRHYHVTHNFREMTGGFEHLSSIHEHDHDHAPLSHAHYPHENFEHEHQGEAHVHDHAEAVRPSTGRKASSRKANGEGAPAASKRTTRSAKG